VKNRESAQLSRMRKKMYIEELEKKVGCLTMENSALREEVLLLKNNTSSSASSTTTPAPPSSHRPHHRRQSQVAAAGVCLLVVLFSFGLFFNSQTHTVVPHLTQSSNSISDAPDGDSLTSRGSNAPLPVGRSLVQTPFMISKRGRDDDEGDDDMSENEPFKRVKFQEDDNGVDDAEVATFAWTHDSPLGNSSVTTPTSSSGEFSPFSSPTPSRETPTPVDDSFRDMILAVALPSHITSLSDSNTVEMICGVVNIHIWPSISSFSLT